VHRVRSNLFRQENMGTAIGHVNVVVDRLLMCFQGLARMVLSIFRPDGRYTMQPRSIGILAAFVALVPTVLAASVVPSIFAVGFDDVRVTYPATACLDSVAVEMAVVYARDGREVGRRLLRPRLRVAAPMVGTVVLSLDDVELPLLPSDPTVAAGRLYSAELDLILRFRAADGARTTVRIPYLDGGPDENLRKAQDFFLGSMAAAAWNGLYVDPTSFRGPSR